MEYKNILVSNKDSVTKLTINRPDKLNVLDMETLNGMKGALAEAANDPKCRIVVIEGAGDRAFCAGADISYLLTLKDDKEVGAFVDYMYSVFHFIETMEKPVIAAIHGYCLGGGCELALACDIRIATQDSRFGQPEVHVGIIPGAGGTYRLPVVVGPAIAKEMVLTGGIVDAQAALRTGLISRIMEAPVEDEVETMTTKINSNSYNAVKEAKKAINATYKIDYSAERAGFVACFKNPDSREGIKAFLEHRPPKFL